MQLALDPNRYAVDSLDGEVFVMDLLEGRLFLLEAGAPLVWDAITRGVSVDALASEIAARYGEAASHSMRDFVADLVAKGLLTPASDEPVPALPVVGSDWPPALGALQLTEYDDMTAIITMDPIHDVDPRRGWPFDPST